MACLAGYSVSWTETEITLRCLFLHSWPDYLSGTFCFFGAFGAVLWENSSWIRWLDIASFDRFRSITPFIYCSSQWYGARLAGIAELVRTIWWWIPKPRYEATDSCWESWPLPTLFARLPIPFLIVKPKFVEFLKVKYIIIDGIQNLIYRTFLDNHG